METARCEPVGNFAAFKIAGEMKVCASGKDDDGRPVISSLPRPEDGERGNVIAGFDFGFGRSLGFGRRFVLRRRSGLEADGLDAKEGVVDAGRGAVGELRVGGGDGECCRDEECEELLHGSLDAIREKYRTSEQWRKDSGAGEKARRRCLPMRY